MNETADQGPDVRLGAALDQIDAEAAESLLGALESDPRGLDRFRAYVRQKRLLRRSANALERPADARTDALADRLAAWRARPDGGDPERRGVGSAAAQRERDRKCEQRLHGRPPRRCWASSALRSSMTSL